MIKRPVSKWFSHFTSHPAAKVNLLCFVFAGGSPSFFAPWKKFVPPWMNLMPVLYPKREKRAAEQMPETLGQLVTLFEQDNAGLFNKPYAIWGHCSGSLIGLELALSQSRRGRPPAAFAVSGCEAPEYALGRLQSSTRDRAFSQVEDESILQDLIDFRLMDPQMVQNPSFREYFLPIYRADLAMLNSYYPDQSKSLSCPALVMNGRQDRMIKPQYIPHWERYFTQKAAFKEYEGEHYFVGDHKEAVIADIAALLEPRREPLAAGQREKQYA